MSLSRREFTKAIFGSGFLAGGGSAEASAQEKRAKHLKVSLARPNGWRTSGDKCFEGVCPNCGVTMHFSFSQSGEELTKCLGCEMALLVYYDAEVGVLLSFDNSDSRHTRHNGMLVRMPGGRFRTLVNECHDSDVLIKVEITCSVGGCKGSVSGNSPYFTCDHNSYHYRFFDKHMWLEVEHDTCFQAKITCDNEDGFPFPFRRAYLS